MSSPTLSSFYLNDQDEIPQILYFWLLKQKSRFEMNMAMSLLFAFKTQQPFEVKPDTAADFG